MAARRLHTERKSALRSTQAASTRLACWLAGWLAFESAHLESIQGAIRYVHLPVAVNLVSLGTRAGHAWPHSDAKLNNHLSQIYLSFLSIDLRDPTRSFKYSFSPFLRFEDNVKSFFVRTCAYIVGGEL